jgi:hypothetical protein
LHVVGDHVGLAPGHADRDAFCQQRQDVVAGDRFLGLAHAESQLGGELVRCPQTVVETRCQDGQQDHRDESDLVEPIGFELVDGRRTAAKIGFRHFADGAFDDLGTLRTLARPRRPTLRHPDIIAHGVLGQSA